MPSIGDTTRPEYIYDQATDTWIPVGIGPHAHTPAAIGAIASSVVTTKGDIIAATGSGVVVRQGVGADGSYLMADSTQADGLNYAGPSTISGKNYVINGGMDWWQRGTTFTTDAAATVIYTADRISAWALFPGAGATQTITRETSSAHIPPNFRYSLKSVVSTAVPVNSGRMALGYTLENHESLALANRTITYSMQVKAIGNIDRLYVYSRYNTSGGTALSGATDAANAFFTINSSGFTTITWTTTVPSATTMTSSGTYGLQLVYYRASGAVEAIGDGIYITGIQMEIGSAATPFSRAGGSIGGELALCQRYFQTIVPVASYMDVLVGSAADSTAYYRYPYVFPIQMRTAPTLSTPRTTNDYANLASGGFYTVSSLPTLESSRTSGCSIIAYSGGVTKGFSATFRNGATGFTENWINLSAEL